MNFAFFLHYLKEKYPCNENVSNSIQGAGLFPHPFYIGLPERFCVKETAQYNFFPKTLASHLFFKYFW